MEEWANMGQEWDCWHSGPVLLPYASSSLVDTWNERGDSKNQHKVVTSLRAIVGVTVCYLWEFVGTWEQCLLSRENRSFVTWDDCLLAGEKSLREEFVVQLRCICCYIRAEFVDTFKQIFVVTSVYPLLSRESRVCWPVRADFVCHERIVFVVTQEQCVVMWEHCLLSHAKEQCLFSCKSRFVDTREGSICCHGRAVL